MKFPGETESGVCGHREMKFRKQKKETSITEMGLKLKIKMCHPSALNRWLKLLWILLA